MKKCFLAVVCVAVVVTGGNALFRQNTQREVFDVLQVGMTKSEVRDLLGGPLAMPDGTRHLRTGEDEEIWLGQDGAILVAFRDEVLCYKGWVENEWIKSLVGFGGD